jgi:hypothetical protein
MAKHDFTYENTSDQDLSIPGVGLIKAGATFHSADEVNNANLKLVEPAKEQATAGDDEAKPASKPKAKGEK